MRGSKGKLAMRLSARACAGWADEYSCPAELRSPAKRPRPSVVALGALGHPLTPSATKAELARRPRTDSALASLHEGANRPGTNTRRPASAGSGRKSHTLVFFSK